MKKIIFLAFFLTAGVSYAQDLKWDPKTTFDGVFDIDAIHTKDGICMSSNKSGLFQI